MVRLPTCCGREMRLAMETLKFLEVHCGACGDVVYLKKEKAERPQLIDD